MEHLISVIVPVHNVESYLEKCIESILTQTYSNLEIILVDGASNDRSGIICDEFASRDSRVKVIHKADLGVTSNRKAGLEISAGEYIAFVDSDDWIERDMYESLLEIALKHNADIVTSGVSRDSDVDIVIRHDAFKEGEYFPQSDGCELWQNLIYSENAKEGILWGMWNKLFRREVVLDNYMKMDDRITRSEDIAVWVAAMLDSQVIYISHQVFYHYCNRSNSIAKTKDEIYFERMNCWFLYLKDKLSQVKHAKGLEAQVDRHMADKVQEGLGDLFPFFGEPLYIKYMFHKELLSPGNKVVIYGAGKVGRDYYKQFVNDKRFDLVLWVDQKSSSSGGKVSAVMAIRETEYDAVIIAVKARKSAEQIRKNLVDMGVEEQKIIWHEPIDSAEYLRGNFNIEDTGRQSYVQCHESNYHVFTTVS